MVENRTVLVNLSGEEYEPMIPGTKCPVSVGVLEHWYWDKRLSTCEIATLIKNDFFVCVSHKGVGDWLKKYTNKPLRDKKGQDFVRRKRGILTCPNNFLTTNDRIVNGRKSWEVNSKKNKKYHENKLKKARESRTRKCALRRINKSCEICGLTFNVPICRNNSAKFCSRSCARKFSSRKQRTFFSGLLCCRCGNNLCRKFTGRKFLSFRCVECLISTIRPFIELGLRQDLEAAGALDDGRILASAFKEGGG